MILFKELVDNISNLYSLYSSIFSDDRNFWKSLSIKKMNDRALIETASNYFAKECLECSDLFTISEETILTELFTVQNALDSCSLKTITQKEALEFSYTIETSEVLEHFSTFLSAKTKTKIDRLLKKLLDNHGDYKKEILNYAKSKNVIITEVS